MEKLTYREKGGILSLSTPRPSIPYSLKMLWRDRHRFLPALSGVGFSAVLISVQCGLVMGLVMCVSAPIDHSSAQIWVLPPGAASLQQTYVFPLSWQARLDLQPEIDRSETYLSEQGRWRIPGQGHTELCNLLGTRLDDGSLGALKALTPEMRAKLAEPGTVIVDAWELGNLGLKNGTGEQAEINGRPVRVVATVHGFHAQNFVYVFCSQETVRTLVPQASANLGLSTCLVAHCRNAQDVDTVVQRLRHDYPDMEVFSSRELSFNVRQYWLLRSRGGIVMICTIVLAVLVGLVITSQTLYAAVVAQLREFAVLEALGIPQRRVIALVLAQSLWLGLGGIAIALPITCVLGWAALWLRTNVILSWEILWLTCGLTLGMAMIAGLSALRPLRNIEPANLLR